MSLAAGHAHMARQCRSLMSAIDHEIMPLRLSCNRLIERAMQEIIASRGAEWTTEVGGVVLAEAHVKRTGASYAHSVAGFTEIMGERRNEPQSSAGFLHAHVTRRSSRAVINVIKCVSGGEACAHN